MLKHTHDQLFKLFDNLKIKYKNYEHPAVFTIEEAQKICHEIPGAHCKTLLLKVDSERYYLVSMLGDQGLKANELRKQIGVKRLSFASPEELDALLGITPGSVTPFALINNKCFKVSLLIDHELMKYDEINFHPLRNDMTTTVSPKELLRLVEYFGHDVKVYELPKKE